MIEENPKSLVNPVSLQDCAALRSSEQRLSILDLSFVRLVVEDDGSEWPEDNEQPIPFVLDLGKRSLSVVCRFHSRGSGWVRLNYEKWLPSHSSFMRFFLTPRRVGESMKEDWRNDRLHHFHGLNESELGFDQEGNLFFSLLDTETLRHQFILRQEEEHAAPQVGRMSREQYIQLETLDADTLLEPLSEKDMSFRLSECRDVITNFRPAGTREYAVKQRLMRLFNSYLYSHGRRI